MNPPYGVQTVSGHCAVPRGAQFFELTTHARRFMQSASVHRYHDGMIGEELVSSTDYENPVVARWSPPYLTFGDDELCYDCSYRNDGDVTVYQGQSATTTEMCMAIGYYFPATATSTCVNSMPWKL